MGLTKKTISVIIKIWRQDGPQVPGLFEIHQLLKIAIDMSFLEMLDVLNEKLSMSGKEPVVFDHDCREGICGMCGFMIDGIAHGPERKTTLCQLHMRHFRDGQTITIEPFRARGFPVIRDLIIDRSSLDHIISAGGYITINTGSAPDANAIPVSQTLTEQAMDAAACIGCGACIAACPNAAAVLFAGAKISQLALLPQGRPERKKRVLSMVKAMDKAGFGNCSNELECENVCPKGITVRNTARLNREYMRAFLTG